MLIRRLREDDIPAVVSLILEDYDAVLCEYHSADVLAQLRAELTPEWLREAMADRQVFVVEDEGVVLATGALADFGTDGKPKHVVSQFFVRAGRHGGGIGWSLLAHLIRVAHDDGVEVLHVPSSRNAVGFYERAGFVVDDAQPDGDFEITWMTMSVAGPPPATAGR